MKIAIVGAAGALGRRTLEEALRRDVVPEDVVVAVRTPEKLSEHADRGVQVRRADYDDPASLAQAFAGVERVLLVPSLAMPGPRALQYHHAIAAAREVGVKHLFHYGLVPTALEAPFVVTPFMLFAEAALRTSGLDWTVLRNSLYADPIADWVPEIVKMGTIPYPTGDGRCAYVSRRDIARAGAAVLTTDGHEGRVYHLTGPQALTTAELCEAVARVTGEPVEYRDATDADYVKACRAGGEPERFTQLLLSLYWTIRDGFCDVAPGDIEALTGTPPERFESFLTRRLGSPG
jgi:NAD(P)H dehydrogenase (quinone)